MLRVAVGWLMFRFSVAAFYAWLAFSFYCPAGLETTLRFELEQHLTGSRMIIVDVRSFE